MFRFLHSSGAFTSTSLVASVQRRGITQLHTSFSRGRLRLNQLTGPRAAIAKGASVTAVLRSGYYKPAPAKAEAAATEEEKATDFEESAEDVDALTKKVAKAVNPSTSTDAAATRPYVPLSDVSRIELQGDYLMEGGQPLDALKYYGVVAKAFTAAYPENDNQRAMITVKLSRAFRCCGKLEAAVANAEHAVFMLDHNDSPHLDLVCEALLELAEAKAARGDTDSGSVYEDVLSVVDAYHSIGNTERSIRMMPRLGVRMGIAHDEKFLYITPFDTDRVFAIADYALQKAEAFYRRKTNSAGVVRVLERRTQMINTKFFEHHDTAGRIKTLRGYSSIKEKNRSFTMTPRELLLYTPTIHQTYHDRSTGNMAPLGREDEVMGGANRRIMDDGHYTRRQTRTQRGDRPPKKLVTKGGVNSMSSIYEY